MITKIKSSSYIVKITKYTEHFLNIIVFNNQYAAHFAFRRAICQIKSAAASVKNNCISQMLLPHFVKSSLDLQLFLSGFLRLCFKIILQQFDFALVLSRFLKSYASSESPYLDLVKSN